MLNLSSHKQQCLDLAHQFRLGFHTQAALDMADELGRLAQQLPPENEQDIRLFTTLMGKMFECQQRQDWLGLADYLEYELQELLTPYCGN